MVTTIGTRNAAMTRKEGIMHSHKGLRRLLCLAALASFTAGAEAQSAGSGCETFDHGSSLGWTAVNASSSFPATGGNPGGYVVLKDQVGPSSLVAPPNLLGDLAQRLGCGQFCFDVNLFANPGGPSAPASISIQGSSPNLVASFIGSSNVTPGSGWHTLCAPIRVVDPGATSLGNAYGSWSTPPPPLSFNAPTWNQIISNVTALRLPVDWGNGAVVEEVGYDNLCFKPCPCPTTLAVRHQYAAKFVCYQSSERPLALVRGYYGTAINVHEPRLPPGPNERVIPTRLAKKVSVALPGEEVGPVSPYRLETLLPDQAFEIDCDDIRKFPGLGSVPNPFTGFVVIDSELPLDVTAVYTARPVQGRVATAQVSTLDVEIIPERRMDGTLTIGGTCP